MDIPAEFQEAITVTAAESLDDFRKREAEGRSFWEGNEKALKRAAQANAHIALEERFKSSAFRDRIFIKKFFVTKVHPDLASERFCRFQRLNQADGESRQRIELVVDLPEFYKEVVAAGS